MKTIAYLTKIIPASISLILCFALLTFAVMGLHWSAAFAAHATTASITSRPPSGPPGTTITVSGTGIPAPANSSIPETVIFGYSTDANCSSFSPVGPGSNPVITNGSFSNATFTWPIMGTMAETTYTVCAQISGVSGGTNPLTLAGNSFLVQGNATSSTDSGTQNTITSSPASGLPGATITVTGSNIPPPAGSATEKVTFGYSPNSGCNLFYKVGSGSNPKISKGSFSGTFSWPKSATTAGKSYTVCARVTNVSGGTLMLVGNSFLATPLITSSPASGSGGTAILVAGTYIPPSSGSATEKVTFGYSPNSGCNLFYKVGSGSNPKISKGSFSGTFSWPKSATTAGKTYTVCARVTNVSGGTLMLVGNSFLATPLITSSPASGSGGTAILVAGTYIPPSSGSATEKVTFGYSPNSGCNLFYKVGSGSNPKISKGSFSGTFPWPTSGTTAGKTYTICIQISNISGGGTLTLASNSPFTVTS